jgi:transposase
MPSPFVIELTDRQRTDLQTMARRGTAPARDVLRARIVLAAADGMGNTTIAARLAVHVDTVRSWRRRFALHGPAGLADRPRSGRPCRYGPAAQLKIVATVTGQVPHPDSHWTHRSIAEHLRDEVGISAAQIGRILAGLDLKPHRVRGWLTRPADPDFFAKAHAVCDLYLNPPADGIVLSIDEKTAIAARSRKHPDSRVQTGRPARREFEYTRHGTVSIIAALDVHTGQVLTETITRNNSVTFIAFLHRLDQHIDPSLTIHLVLDNGASHTSKATRTWLTEHPRFQTRYTPKHASWLNQIELFFSTLTRRLLRRGQATSRHDLADQIEDFVIAYDQTAKPYRWTYDGSPLKAA